ncbi:hypothetical protein [Mycetocola sp. JXN-3]|uniref:hypothetical protein n=1 Tax=Mycetocola sp. JXN-3 TaxID=2116510 RepID=UPI00165CFAC7|nr:hypothetical protein [Mycetocola sp. JXN-3]
MGTLMKGIWLVVFPRTDSNGRPRVSVSIRFLFLLALLPILCGIVSVWNGLEIVDPSVVASSVGVLGGLLIAHAIFVFQLRVSLMSKGKKKREVDNRVFELVDQMFDGVLWSSTIALLLTLVSGAIAAFLPEEHTVDRWITGAFVVLAVHLVGCLVHVITATMSAFQILRKP